MEVSLARGSARDSVVVSFAASPSPSVAEYSVELDSSITFNSSALRRVVAPSPDAIAFTGLELRTWFARVGAQAAAEIAYRVSLREVACASRSAADVCVCARVRALPPTALHACIS
jgi:hypothetical protein